MANILLTFLCCMASVVPHNLWREEGSSNSLARKTEKNSQDGPENMRLVKECLCFVAGKPAYLGVIGLTLSSLHCASSCAGALMQSCRGAGQKKGKIGGDCELALAAELIESKKWLARYKHPVRHLAGLFYLDCELFSAEVLHPIMLYDILGSISRQINK